MKCPRCAQSAALKPEVYEGVEVDRCSRCQGVWLDDKELTKILAAKETTFAPALIESTLKGAFAGVTEGEKASTEHCPKCDGPMVPVNFSYSSGVIIDRCHQHGIWLDGTELEKMQAHAEHWEKEKESRAGEWTKLCEAARDQHLAERVAWEKKNKISPIGKVMMDIAELLG